MLAGASRGAIRLQLELPVWQRWKTWSCSFHVRWSPLLHTGQKGFSSGVVGSRPRGQSQVANPSVALGVCSVAFTAVPSWLFLGGLLCFPRAEPSGEKDCEPPGILSIPAAIPSQPLAPPPLPPVAFYAYRTWLGANTLALVSDSPDYSNLC